MASPSAFASAFCGRYSASCVKPLRTLWSYTVGSHPMVAAASIRDSLRPVSKDDGLSVFKGEAEKSRCEADWPLKMSILDPERPFEAVVNRRKGFGLASCVVSPATRISLRIMKR